MNSGRLVVFHYDDDDDDDDVVQKNVMAQWCSFTLIVYSKNRLNMLLGMKNGDGGMAVNLVRSIFIFLSRHYKNPIFNIYFLCI